MLKHSLKVIGITLLCIAMVFAFAIMWVAVFYPSSLAKIYDDIGFRYRAKVYAEKAYEKDSKFEDLVLLTNLSIKCEDGESTYKYAKKLLEHQEFDGYIAQLDSGISYYDFIASTYIKAGYTLNKWSKQETVNRALSYARDQYRYSNPMENLILVAVENNDVEILSNCLSALISYKNGETCVTEAVALARLNTDIDNLTVVIERLNEEAELVE